MSAGVLSDAPDEPTHGNSGAPPEGWTALAAEDLRALAWLHEAERSPAMLVALYEHGFPDTLCLSPAEQPARQAMDAALAALAGRGDGSLPASSGDELAADFAAIYLPHGLRAAPFESVWLDEDHLVMQGPTFAVREFYRRHGMQVLDWRKLADDHISHELQFVALLLERGEQREAARFLAQHLMAWLPDFAQRVGQRAATPFYAALAMLTLACCEQCRQWLPRVVPMPGVTTEPAAGSTPGCGR